MMPYGYQGYQDELRRRLEKLSRTYDLTTMKIFMTVEALGDNNVYSTYEPVQYPAPGAEIKRKLNTLSDEYSLSTMKILMTELALGRILLYSVYDPSDEKRANWEPFLVRREACRLDLTHHEKTREKYQHFLKTVGREEQGKQFFHSMISLMQSKGAVDVFKHSSGKTHDELETTFCGHLCKLFDKKIDNWFDAFEAVNVRLTAHVKVSNFVRVVTGQVDVLCRKAGFLYAINIKVTGMTTPRPMDVNEMCLVKAMIIQNGLAEPDYVVCCLLVCHLGEDRPVLRLWEYRPKPEMDTAIKEADIDNMIDAGRLTLLHEMWPGNVSQPGMGGLTERMGHNKNHINNINGGGPANGAGRPYEGGRPPLGGRRPYVVAPLNNGGRPYETDRLPEAVQPTMAARPQEFVRGYDVGRPSMAGQPNTSDYPMGAVHPQEGVLPPLETVRPPGGPAGPSEAARPMEVSRIYEGSGFYDDRRPIAQATANGAGNYNNNNVNRRTPSLVQ